MTGKQFFVIAALSLIVGTTFLSLDFLLLTGFIQGEVAQMSEPANVSPATAAPGQETGFMALVTDPQAVALTLDEVPLDFHLERANSGYVDNSKALLESSNPQEAWLEMELTGRMNGYQVVFSSDDPQAHTVYILNVVQTYRSVEGARQALDVSPPYTPFLEGALYTLEETSALQIGETSRAWRVFLPSREAGKEDMAACVLLFQRNNVLVEVALLGKHDYPLLEEAAWYAQSVDRRIRSFGRGQAS
ncbi:MAG: hypothetical protein ACUVV0_14325 [Anaerolineae bacterium]